MKNRVYCLSPKTKFDDGSPWPTHCSHTHINDPRRERDVPLSALVMGLAQRIRENFHCPFDGFIYIRDAQGRTWPSGCLNGKVRKTLTLIQWVTFFLCEPVSYSAASNKSDAEGHGMRKLCIPNTHKKTYIHNHAWGKSRRSFIRGQYCHQQSMDLSISSLLLWRFHPTRATVFGRSNKPIYTDCTSIQDNLSMITHEYTPYLLT